MEDGINEDKEEAVPSFVDEGEEPQTAQPNIKFTVVMIDVLKIALIAICLSRNGLKAVLVACLKDGVANRAAIVKHIDPGILGNMVIANFELTAY